MSAASRLFPDSENARFVTKVGPELADAKPFHTADWTSRTVAVQPDDHASELGGEAVERYQRKIRRRLHL